MSRYLQLQLLVNVSYGVVIGLGLYVIGVPTPCCGERWRRYCDFFRHRVAARRGVTDPALAGCFRDVDKTAIHGGAVPGRRATGGKCAGAATIRRPYGDLFVRDFACSDFLGAAVGTDRIAAVYPADGLRGGAGPTRSSLGFLNIMLGDQPVLSPEAHYYQRLLASDQTEAKHVLEEYLKANSLEELYDSVLIPALALAEQDRHHDDLEAITEKFICQSTKELLEDLAEKLRRKRRRPLRSTAEDSEA